MWLGVRFHVVTAHFGTLGFPGEGPPKRPARNPHGYNNHSPAPPPTDPPIATPSKTTASSTAPASGSSSGLASGKRGHPIIIYTPEWVEQQLEQEDGLAIIAARLNTASRRAREWKRKAEGSQAEVRGGDLHLPKQEPSMAPNNQQRRVAKLAVTMCATLYGRPNVDQAKAVNDLIETCLDRETRLLIRQESYVQRERYVAVRWAVGEMNANWWTAHNWLELRLKKFLSMRVFTLGGKLFSQKQDAEGSWQRAVLMPIPAPAWRARQDGIYTPLFVPNPFRNPVQIKAAQEKVLEGFHFDISADGKAVSLDPLERGYACLKHAQLTSRICERRRVCPANVCACKFCWMPSGILGRAVWPRALVYAHRTCTVGTTPLTSSKTLLCT